MSLELDVPASGAARQGALLPPFASSCRNGGLDAAWVHVGGELDIATTRRLERTLDECKARLVVLDLRELAFFDSCGCTASSAPAFALGGRAAGWCSCASPRTSTAC